MIVFYECGCTFTDGEATFLCSEADEIADHENWEELIDEHYEGQESYEL